MKSGFTDIARVGSHRRVDKALLEWVVHGAAGRDTKQVKMLRVSDLSESIPYPAAIASYARCPIVLLDFSWLCL